jgi:hypothetical protein
MKNTLPKSYLMIGLLVCQWLLSVVSVSAFGARQPVEDTTCFYVNLNRVYEDKILELHHSAVCFEYEDFYGQAPHLKMEFYNWQRELIASVEMPKHYGKNSYSLNLQQLGLPFNNQIFTLEVTTETGRKMESVFRLVPPPDKPDPLVDIFVNPVKLKCNAPEGNLVEFYGTISGGKAPYQLEWTVTNASQSALLYQPKKVEVSREGSTPAIQVDQTPGYQVQLSVTDACGKVGRQAVQVQCESNYEKANSLLFQPIPTLPSIGTPPR